MSQKITFFSNILFLLFCPLLMQAQYCTPTAAVTCDETINNVTLNTINNTSSGCGTVLQGYSDYTSQSTTLNAAQTYTISVTVGPSYLGDSVCVWIDYNHNQVFETSELVTILSCYTNSTTSTTCTGSFTVPFSALSGNARMRVKVNYSGTGSKNPCVDGQYGEAEDYTVNIVYPYCIPSASISCDETITNVTLNTINNTSSGCGTTSQGYSNFTTQSTTLNTGQLYTISATVSPVFSSDSVFVWIDYNHNFVFDAAERVAVLSCYGSASTCSGTFTLPGTALSGNTRMRVKLSFSNSGNNNPCVDGNFGEAEDYTVNINVVNYCSGQPLAPLISTSSPVSICSGSTQSIVATDPNTSVGILYQWQQAASASGPWSNIAGATSLSYTSAALSSSTYFRLKDSCTASNLTNTSTVFTANIIAPPTIGSQPVNAVSCSGSSAVFSTGVSGVGLSYQWQVNAGSGFVNVPNSPVYLGANSSTLNLINPTPSMNGYTYKCIITDNCGNSLTTNIVSFHTGITPAVPLITPAGPVNICGTYHTLYTSFISSLTYQWQMNGSNIAGATNPSYTATVSGNYNVIVSSGYCSSLSAPVGVAFVSTPAAPVVSPAGPVKFCPGYGVTLFAPGTAGLNCQWYNNNNPISGANANNWSAIDSGIYTLVVTNGNGCSSTSNAVNVIQDIINPVVTYNGSQLCTGTFASYQWYYYSSYIPGATSQCYSPTKAGPYYVVVSDSVPCFKSSNSFVITNLGISATAAGNNAIIKMYPNPASTMVHIDAPMKVKTVISNLQGKVVLVSNDITIDISRLADGVYISRFFDEDNTILATEKLLKFAQ